MFTIYNFTSMYEWDVFISHASEDTEDVALPLTRELRRRGLRVWIDVQELQLGDPLYERIGDPLTHSRFAVVIISPNSMTKHWPRREMNTLLALEEDGVKRVLPVWHDVTHSEAAAAFPFIADRLAGSTAGGLPALAATIASIVLDPRHQSPATVDPPPSRRLVSHLEEHPDPASIRQFLQRNSSLIEALFRHCDSVVWSPVFGELSLDLAVAEAWRSASRTIWSLVVLGRADEALTNAAGEISPAIVALTERVQAIRAWIATHLEDARQVLDEIETGFSAAVIVGRRPPPDSTAADVLRSYNDQFFDLRVRTYDWLIDAALKAEDAKGNR